MRMRRVLPKGLLVVGLVAALCVCGLAAENPTAQNQGAPTGSGTGPGQPGMMQPGMTGQMPQAGTMTLERASRLLGKEVKNPQGDTLGTVHDIVLTPDHQQVSYVALSSGGVLGMGKTLHAIPWQAVKMGSNGEIIVNASKEQLKQITGFSTNNWPSQGNPAWLSASAAGQGQTATEQGQTAATEGTGTANSGRSTARTQRETNPGAAMGGQSQTAAGESQAMGAAGQSASANQSVQMQRVTRLTGTTVKNPQGQDLGTLEDFAINPSTGSVVYDIIAFGGVAGIGEKFAAVPAGAVRIQSQTHVALLDATSQTLESATFKPSELATLSSPEQMRRLQQMFPAQTGGTALGYLPAQSPQAQQAANESAWGPSSPFAKTFNSSMAKTITGTVDTVGSFLPEGASPGAALGLRLRVQTSDGNIMTVYGGPVSYAEQKDFYMMPGDQITITGAQTKIGQQTIFVASELKKGTATLQLRDRSGKPLWTTATLQSQSQFQGQTELQPSATTSRTRSQSKNRTRSPQQ